jgi:hypothetical protein
MNKKNLCTISDESFMIKGLTLYQSLLDTSNNFILHYLCIDEEIYLKYKHLESENLLFYNIQDFLKKDLILLKLKEKNYKYFCWSLASYFSNFLLQTGIESISYIDSDIYFHEDIDYIFQEIQDKDIGVFRHRMFELGYNYSEGLFNVGFVYFKNTDIGKSALNWWSDSVLNELHPEFSTCGDQKYLDFFYINYFENLFIDGNIGHGAPWHWQLYDFSDYIENGNIIWENKKQKLIFSHFSQFIHDFNNDNYIPSTMHHCYTPLEYYKNRNSLKFIYDEYYKQLKKIKLYYD